MPFPQMTGLNRSFQTTENYKSSTTYRLLPLRFTRLDSPRYLVSSMAGEYAILSSEALHDLINHRLPMDSQVYNDLLAKHLVADDDSNVYHDLLASKILTRHSRLSDWTALHMFVVTLRCDHSCQYCQVSRVSEDREAFDMNVATADKAIGLMFQSPSPVLKVEFQGGESLLNFPLIRHIVGEVKRRNDGREIQFIITTNLANLTDEMLEFAAEHSIFFSTSLDGPAELHNKNRPRPGKDSHAKTESSITRIRQKVGFDAVSALMTSTAAGLTQPEAIIDEYVRLGFSSIFLRCISPYGFAVKTAGRIGYETGAFIEFFKRGLAHILELNKRGMKIVETYTQLLLRRMLTPFPTGYVDLQSPAGMGIAAIVYNYNGEVYSADEGRMLAEMGDTTFKLGTVDDTYAQLFLDSPLLSMTYETMSEGIPQCSECALQPYCGTDPVFHHRTQGDIVGHRPTSAFCQRNMELMKHIVLLLEDDPAAAKILKSWVPWN